jgi:glycosyltransferase 2 family protein
MRAAAPEAGAPLQVGLQPPDAETAAEPMPTTWQRAWAKAKRYAPWLLSLLVLGLLARQIHVIEWPTVWQAVQQQSLTGLLLACALALLSYTAFASYDLIGRHVTGHRVTVPRTLGIAAACYAFNVNFGALVGALALKFRLYGLAGVKASQTARVIGLSVVTNWLGYLVVAGTVLALAPPPLPAPLALNETAVRWMGALMLAAGAVYLLLCATGPAAGRSLAWRSHRFHLPSGRVALWQLAVSGFNWSLMGVIVWVLLAHRVDYPTVLGVLLLAAIAGVVAHVPAGLGVIEGVFIACLGGQVPHGQLLAALLAYRATYYLMPLALAAAGYALREGRRKAPAAAPSERAETRPLGEEGRR